MTIAILAALLTTSPGDAAVRPPKGVPAWPWFAIARCEQGMYGPGGFKGVKWWAYSESYEGGYGFRHETWDRFKFRGMPDSASKASPAQQTRVAMRLRAFFGNYSSWPSCHRRLGLP